MKGFRWAAIAGAVMALALALLLIDAPSLRTGALPAEVANAPVSGSETGEWSGTVKAKATAEGAAGSDAEVPAEMRQQFADIARAYAENARYPDYAKPLSANDWNLLHPRAFVPRQAQLANIDGVTAMLVIAQSIVDRAVALPVKVLITAEPGAQAIPRATGVRVMLQRKGQRSALLPLAAVNDADAADGQVFAGVLPATALRAVPEGEAAVIAELVFDNGVFANATATVKLYEAAARLMRLGETRVEGADLVIPANFEVTRPGQYRVSANLFRSEGGEPVSHLNAEFALTAQNSAGLLKAHAVTLRAKEAAGPYVLRDVDITRLPDKPGDVSGHGSAVSHEFEVRGFPLDAYSHEPYEDPATKQRLEFLQKMVGAK